MKSLRIIAAILLAAMLMIPASAFEVAVSDDSVVISQNSSLYRCHK